MKTDELPDRQPGSLPPWQEDELPAPLPFGLRNALKTIGPGAILLVGAIGMGEWIAGPLFVVQHGRGVLWIATLAFVLQSLLNLEAVRYTLYTGEPVITGLMRMRPGSRVWGTAYGLAACAQLGMPAAAAGCAGVAFALWQGRAPVDADHTPVTWITVALVVVATAVLCSGRKVERLLERLSWMMILFIFGFLLWVNVTFVPFGDWGRTFAGFFQFGTVPEQVDFVMLAVFAALAGSGGIGNLAIASWFRDKGFGMGAKTGNLGGVWSREQTLAPVGRVFPITAENLRRWRDWWRYAILDQSGLWLLGCIVGMFLMVNLASSLFEPGMEISGVAAGVFQASEMRKVWEGFWLLALMNGFWILFSTTLTNVDVLARVVTDILWAGGRTPRTMPVGRLYGLLLLGFTVLACLGAFLGDAKLLLTILGTAAAPINAFSALQILRLNTTLLPRELRPPLWRKIALVACALFYGAITVAMIQQLLSA
jgi:hypothetical protein